MKNKHASIFLTISIFTIFFTGCTAIVELPVHPVNFQQTEKIDMTVQLDLSDELLKTQWETGSGDKIIIPIGDTIAYNSESLARTIFSNVIVVKNLPGSMEDKAAANLIPRVVSMKHTRPLLIFQDQQTTLTFNWTLKDDKGDIIWLKTITAEAKSVMGGFTSGTKSKEHVKILVNDLFKKSFDEISSAEEIREFAATH